MKYLIGLPSYNEEKTISDITNIINIGLTKYLKFNDTAKLLLVDSNSSDDTKSRFINTKTKYEKIVINNQSLPRGKGNNIFIIFKYAIENNFDYVLLFDTDLISIHPIWLKKYIECICKYMPDLIIPSYTRNKYEGSATNHFAVPIIYGLTGIFVRQPLAGDFALSKDFIKVLLEKNFHQDTLLYGIDIFITYNAVIHNRKFKILNLNKKIHKPSFPNLPIMFTQIVNSLLFQVGKIIPSNKKMQPIHNYFQKQKIISSFSHKKSALILRDESLIYVKANIKNSIYYKIFLEIINKQTIEDEIWANILYFTLLNGKLSEIDIQLLKNLYIIRVVGFWFEIENSSQELIEKRIVSLSKLLFNLIHNTK